MYGWPEYHIGHNPVDALAIIALLLMVCDLAGTGQATYNDIDGDWLGELREGFTSAMLTSMGTRALAIFTSSWLHGKNLVGVMISGHKTGLPNESIHRTWSSVAGPVLVAVLGFQWTQWQSAPSAGVIDRPAASVEHHDTDHDDY